MLPAIARMPALRLSAALAAFDPPPALRLRLRMPSTRSWLSGAVLATSAGLYLVAALSLSAVSGEGNANAREASVIAARVAMLAPPPAEPLRFRALPPEDALAINAAVPVATGPNPAAAAFALGGADIATRSRSLECLTAAVYYEAATEAVEGQRAVAQVILNRVRHPAYPKTVCGVVWQGSERVTGCQFTFTCDGSLRRAPMASYWARARKVAWDALSGHVYAPVGWATHYHTNYVVPYWSSSLTKAAVIGTHIFYRWTGGWGRGPAFRQRYAGVEPDVSGLGRRTAMPVVLVEGDAVDAAAAAAAAAAMEAGTSQVAPGPGSVDSFNRAVLRRYEPLTREAAANAAIARSGEPASTSHRWAMGAAGAGTTGAPLGRRAETPAAAVPAAEKAEDKPALPACLDGVRKAPGTAQGAAEPGKC